MPPLFCQRRVQQYLSAAFECHQEEARPKAAEDTPLSWVARSPPLLRPPPHCRSLPASRMDIVTRKTTRADWDRIQGEIRYWNALVNYLGPPGASSSRRHARRECRCGRVAPLPSGANTF